MPWEDSVTVTDNNGRELHFNLTDKENGYVLQINADLVEEDVRAVGDELYSTFTPINLTPPYDLTWPTIWGLYRTSFSIEGWARLDTIKVSGPTITLEAHENKDMITIVVYDDICETVSSLETAFDVEVPEELTDTGI